MARILLQHIRILRNSTKHTLPRHPTKTSKTTHKRENSMRALRVTLQELRTKLATRCWIFRSRRIITTKGGPK